MPDWDGGKTKGFLMMLIRGIHASLQSVVGNVMHTLIEIDADSAASRLAAPETSARDVLKLPVVIVDDDEISDLDHIAIACRIGKIGVDETFRVSAANGSLRQGIMIFYSTR